MSSKQNGAEQKRRHNVIENPLRRPGEKSRAWEKRGLTRGGSGQRGRRMVAGFSLHSAGPPRKDLSVDISCVHTDERTRSIVNGRLMEWNSHRFVLSPYIHPVVSAIPSAARPNRKTVAARRRCSSLRGSGRLNSIFFSSPPAAALLLDHGIFLPPSVPLYLLFLNSGFKWRRTQPCAVMFFLRCYRL